MATVDELLVLIDASTERLRREMRGATGAVNTFERRTNSSLRKIELGFSKLGRGVSLLLPLLAGAGLSSGIREAVAATADLADTADKLGISAETLQELRFASEQVGVATRTTDLAVQRFTRRLGEAAQGSGELKDTLAQYNIAVTDSAGKTRQTIDVLGDLAQAIEGAGSQQERLRIAFKAFDSEGAAMVNILTRGRAGLQAFQQSARDSGAVIREELVREAQVLEARFKAIIAQLSTGFKSAVVEAVSGISEFSRTEQIDKLGTRIDALQRRLEKLQVGFAGAVEAIDPEAGIIGRRIEADRKRLAKLQAELARLQAGPVINIGPGVDETAPVGVRPQQAAPDADAVQEYIASLRQEVVLLEQVAGQADVVRAGFEAANAAKTRGTELTDAEADQVAELAEKIKGLTDSRKADEEAARAQKDTMRQLGVTFTSAFEDAVLAGDKLRDVVQGLAQDLIKIALRRTVTEPLFAAVSAGASGLFGGFRAEGGPVTGGRSYIVGERGPELFVPPGAGTIVPNGASAGGGMNITVNQNIAPGVSRAELAAILPRMKAETIQAVIDGAARGGASAKMLRGTA